LTAKERAAHANLILLCPDHHAVIDAQPRTYSVPVLRQMKADHEARVAQLQASGQAVESTPLVRETLYGSLMPLTHLPALVFSAETPYTDTQYEEAKKKVRYPHDHAVLVPFLLRGGRLFTFFDMRRNWHPFKDLVGGAVTEVPAQQWWEDPEGSRRYVTLLNRAMHKLTGRRGIRYDPAHYRYYFVPIEKGKVRDAAYRLQTGQLSNRHVVWQPITKATGEPKKYWVHLAARLSFIQNATRQWCLAVRPERHLSKDGEEPLDFDVIGRRVTKMKAKMYNDKYLGELYLWMSALSENRPRLTIKLGGQSIIVESKLLPFGVEWPGVCEDAPDKRVAPVEDDLFSLLDLEDATTGGDDEIDEEEDAFDDDETPD
jgi:hypothetical protein